MLSPQDDRSTAAVQASLASGQTAAGRTVDDRARHATTDRFRRTSDRAFLGLVAELARSDRAS